MKSFHMRNLKFIDTVFIFLAGVCLFTVGLSSQEIISFEARFYLFALEIWRHGANWFPTTYQQPYPDYPVTSTYLIYLVSRLFGTLNKFTAVLPSAIASAITLVMTYLIGASESRRWGWCAVFFLLFTMTFITEARTISLDQYVTMVTVMCFYLVTGALSSRAASSAGSSAFNSRGPALEAVRDDKIAPQPLGNVLVKRAEIAFLLIFAFAIRGPLGIVIPAGVVCVSYLLEKKFKPFFIFGLSAALLLILCSAILLALAYHVGGHAFVQDVIRMQIGSRLQDVSQLPVLFYFTESFGGYAVTYPLAILVAMACLPVLFKENASSDIQLIRKCLGWVLVIIVGLSIPADKKMRYILPLAPALALISAYLYAGTYQNRFLSLIKNIFKSICFILPLIALAFLSYLYIKQIKYGLNYPILFAVFMLLQLLIFVWRKQTVVILGLAAMTFFIANVWIIETINQNTNRTRDFVLQLETLREQAHSPLVFFQEGSDGLPIKYLVNMSKEEKPIYLYQEDELLTLKPNTLVIVGEENLPHIPTSVMKHFKVMMHNKVGHDGVVVISRTVIPRKLGAVIPRSF